ncbi:hypothetical protein BCR42DRAFT_429327 [Absidia repens]|uniref:F-box domain-containing protein n=1 Tax=Absidia repens TaxID=90262 RepID=A0A1X2HWY1_9FUNG|nr:hypothetical protein BCR42DRAFT_429327 [Absidia repens]
MKPLTTDRTPHAGLPNELLQTIFDQVPRSSLAQLVLVSRQWHAVGSPLLYRHIYIRTLVHWHRLVACCTGSSKPPLWLRSSVTSLVLRPSPRLIPRSSTGLLRNARGLVTDRDVEDQGYVRIQQVDLDNTGLERLLIQKNDGDDSENYTDMDTTIKEAEWLTKVTDMEMAQVLTQCPQLVYLQVSGCTQIGDATMYALAGRVGSSSAGGGGGMRGLWLDLTRHITPVAWMTFIHAEQKKKNNLQQQQHHTLSSSSLLHHLDLSYCGFVTDTCLTKALPVWTSSITHLRLCSLYDITDETVLAIAQHCPQLRLLHLSRCFRITNHSLIQLAASPMTSTLVYLSLAFLNQVNEQGIKSLVHSCEFLRVLDISGTGINPMFKQIIIHQWDQDREQKKWGKVRYQEEPVLLL